MSSSPRSVRLDDDLLNRLKEYARGGGLSLSAAMERLLDEALKSERHPLICFRDGPSGRRAGLVQGPDVWEVMGAVHGIRKELANPSPQAVLDEIVETTGLDVVRVKAALAYYADFPAEIDAWIKANDDLSAELYDAWLREQAILGASTA